MAPPRQPPVSLSPGMMLGDFRLDRKIAQGGMAEIWGAQAVSLERPDAPVALKILLTEFSKDASFRDMFQDEVSIATRLDHDNIVRVRGVHEADGHLFQSMELIVGHDLRRILSLVARRRQQVPVPLALLIGQKLASALTYAHGRQSEDGKPLDIVHRDVSPHNVMVSKSGQVKLLDFGIAKATERLARTRPGVIKGKLAYMAPEQALAVGVTPQTDIFALGVVLWEMLAMERLFRPENDAEVLELVVRAEVPAITEKNSDVPHAVELLLRRMMEQRAPNRPDSMQEVESRLSDILGQHFEIAESNEAKLAAWLERVQSSDEAGEEGVELKGDATVPTPMTFPDLETEIPQVHVDEGPTEEKMVESTAPAASAKGFDDTSPTVATPVPDSVKTVLEGLEPVTPSVSAITPVAVNSSSNHSSSGGAPNLKVRRPTQVEIQRAIDATTTVPVEADPRVAAPTPMVQSVESVTQPRTLVPPHVELSDWSDPSLEAAQPMPRHSTVEGAMVPGGARSEPAVGDPLDAVGRRPSLVKRDPMAVILPFITLGLAVVVVVLLVLLIWGK